MSAPAIVGGTLLLSPVLLLLMLAPPPAVLVLKPSPAAGGCDDVPPLLVEFPWGASPPNFVVGAAILGVVAGATLVVLGVLVMITFMKHVMMPFDASSVWVMGPWPGHVTRFHEVPMGTPRREAAGLITAGPATEQCRPCMVKSPMQPGVFSQTSAHTAASRFAEM